jgi:hypothetical protein
VLQQPDVCLKTLADAVDKMLYDKSCQKTIEQVKNDVSGLNGLETAVNTIAYVAENHL